MLLRVREFRRKAGLSQADLASQSECSRELISAIETQRHCPKVDLLSRIARALCVPLWSLIDEPQPRPAVGLRTGTLPVGRPYC